MEDEQRPPIPGPIADFEVDDDTEALRRRFGAIVGEPVTEPAVDVRSFLLDPPPTSEQVAHAERRRLLVRRGSLAAAAVLAVILLAPWPSSSPAPVPERDASTTASDALPVGLDEPPASESGLPRRIDTATPHRPRARPTRARPRQDTNGTSRLRAARTTPTSTESVQRYSPPAAPVRRPAARTTPRPSGGAAELVPMM